MNQIISLECPHTTERVEPFFTLSVEVKNQSKLEKSLELFIQDDILEGDNKYHCSQCNAKVSDFLLLIDVVFSFLVLVFLMN